MSKIGTAFKLLPKAIMNPGTAINLAWRRLFPYGIRPKDPEAYRIGSWSYGNAARVPIQKIFSGIEDCGVEIRNAYKRNPITSLDFQEAGALCAIAKFMQAKKVLEIGTFDGNTTLNLAVNTVESAKITTIDLPLDWDGKSALDIPALYNNVTDRNEVGEQYKSDSEINKKINQVYCDTGSLNWDELGGPFDLVFIDGCHHKVYVKNDTENALKILSESGILVWHDYGMIEDVSEVADELVGSENIKVIGGTRLAVFRK